MSKDTIYREDAIDEMERIMADHPLQGYEDELLLIDAIKSLPSAGRPQGWIPCSERQPAREGHYLCSFKKPRCVDNIYVDLAYWTGGRWYGYLAPEIKAWMPLPKPWKGADDDTD